MCAEWAEMVESPFLPTTCGCCCPGRSQSQLVLELNTNISTWMISNRMRISTPLSSIGCRAVLNLVTSLSLNLNTSTGMVTTSSSSRALFRSHCRVVLPSTTTTSRSLSATISHSFAFPCFFSSLRSGEESDITSMSTAITSSSSARPASSLIGDPKAGQTAHGTDSASILTVNKPLCLRIGLHFELVDMMLRSRWILMDVDVGAGAGSGVSEATRMGSGSLELRGVAWTHNVCPYGLSLHHTNSMRINPLRILHHICNHMWSLKARPKQIPDLLKEGNNLRIEIYCQLEPPSAQTDNLE